MNKYDIINLKKVIEDRNKISCFLDNRLLFNGESNIDEIDVDYDAFLDISRSLE